MYYFNLDDYIDSIDEITNFLTININKKKEVFIQKKFKHKIEELFKVILKQSISNESDLTE